MSAFSKAIESILKSFSKHAQKQAGEISTRNATKPASTNANNDIMPRENQQGREVKTQSQSDPAQKQIHKEQRGIYNVTYNGKIATYIKTDLDSIDNAIRYARGNKNKGAKHIKLGHTQDKNQEGYITQDELLNLGQNIRKFLSEQKTPFIDKDGSRIYEWQDKNGNKFRAVSSFKKFSESGGGANSSITTTANTEHIITFYSDRNAKNKMDFKNPALNPNKNQQNPLDSSSGNIFERE